MNHLLPQVPVERVVFLDHVLLRFLVRCGCHIALIASNKTDDQIVKYQDGMVMILEYLRDNGIGFVASYLKC